MNLKNVLNKKGYFRIAGIATALLLILLIPSLENGINRSVLFTFAHVRGEIQPDTNIVIIDISESDINNLGHWPVKRSYYALLINSLTKYGVKKIGLEVFLSAKYVTQTLYDNLLTNEIKKAGNVVLSSVAGDIYSRHGLFYTDSLSYPSPKLLDDNLNTGHLNYFNNNGVRIPLVIRNNNISEMAFALKLAGKNADGYGGKSLDVNFISGWGKFKHIGLIKYFSMVNNRNRELESLKGKTVIIGTSDPLISSSIKTVFDNNMPGVALHAFALDNILKERGLNNNFEFPSALLFLILVASLLWIREKNLIGRFYLFLLFSFISFIVLTFILFAVFNVLFNYAFFILPFVFFVLSDIILFFMEKDIMLEGAIDESNLLKSLLVIKEDELKKFQKALDMGIDSSESLVGKIKMLKEDIRILKENEEDKKEVESNGKTGAHEFQNIVFRSKSMFNVMDLIQKVAPGDANILIPGRKRHRKRVGCKCHPRN